MNAFDKETDVIVVGSGSAAMTAALAAHEAGSSVLVLESTDLFGGSSAMSGGGLWVPNNPVMREAGTPDSHEAARTYMDTVIGDVGPASSPERREAFLTEGPSMVAFLRRLGPLERQGILAARRSRLQRRLREQRRQFVEFRHDNSPTYEYRKLNTSSSPLCSVGQLLNGETRGYTSGKTKSPGFHPPSGHASGTGDTRNLRSAPGSSGWPVAS